MYVANYSIPERPPYKFCTPLFPAPQCVCCGRLHEADSPGWPALGDRSEATPPPGTAPGEAPECPHAGLHPGHDQSAPGLPAPGRVCPAPASAAGPHTVPAGPRQVGQHLGGPPRQLPEQHGRGGQLHHRVRPGLARLGEGAR